MDKCPKCDGDLLVDVQIRVRGCLSRAVLSKLEIRAGKVKCSVCGYSTGKVEDRMVDKVLHLLKGAGNEQSGSEGSKQEDS